MQGIGRFGPKTINADTVELQPPLDKIVESGICELRVSQYYFDEPLFDEYELSTVRATWDFDAAESFVRDGHSIADLGCGDGRLLLLIAQKHRLKTALETTYLRSRSSTSDRISLKRIETNSRRSEVIF